MTAKILSKEQELVLQSAPGFILSAGAGSGKTFIIVEYLVNYIHNNLKNSSIKEIREFLSQIYLMTFTKKATAEILFRVMTKVSELKNNSEFDCHFWSTVSDNLFRIKISTIDSFCLSLLEKTAYLQDFNQISIKSNELMIAKLEKIFTEWVEISGFKNKLDDNWSFSDLFSAIVEIFNDPEARLDWYSKNINIGKDGLAIEFKEVLQDYIKGHKFNLISSDMIEIDFSNIDSKKPVYELLSRYMQLHNSHRIFNFKDLSDLLFSFKQFPREVDGMSSFHKELRAEIKELHTFLKDMREDYSAALADPESYFSWQVTLKEILNFIEKNYHQIPGYSFSDISYFTLRALRESKDIGQILPTIKLMIVDEFQDTSRVQFEILSIALRENFKKLIAVGDKKQAIYGFRGGDVGVYANCENILGEQRILFLDDNYRSEENIVQFNNSFFSKVFSTEQGYEESDFENEIYKKQNPKKNAGTGEIRPIVIENVDYKIEDLDLLEAISISNEIQVQIESGVQEIAVLYKNLSPSMYLIERLVDFGNSFVAQVKVDTRQDLIVVLCKKIVKFLLTQVESDQKAILKLVKLLVETIKGKALEVDFYLDRLTKANSVFGFYNAFMLFLADLGISTVNFSQNLLLIKDFWISSGNSLELFSYKLETAEVKYSINFVHKQGGVITILTAHQSKGLEYESVILGGIYSNGHYPGLRRTIGNFEGSFKWYSKLHRKKYKSIKFILDEKIEKEKTFLESKRLFYVACTRAKITLSWIHLKSSSEQSLRTKNSWATALIKFCDFKNETSDSSFSANASIKTNLKPLCYKVDTGLRNFDNSNNYKIIPDLSVTRLSRLILCPRLFYLESVCKINPPEPEPELLSIINTAAIEPATSSKRRGVHIHKLLNSLLNDENKFKPSSDEEKEILHWVDSKLKQKNFRKFFSEKEIKFEINGMMVNAIPDLVLIGNDYIEIIDFKTGKMDAIVQDSYFLQIYYYLYAYLKIYPEYSKFKLSASIFYLDHFSVNSKDLNFDEIVVQINESWLLMDKFNQVNLNYCQWCNFYSLCKYSQAIDTH